MDAGDALVPLLPVLPVVLVVLVTIRGGDANGVVPGIRVGAEGLELDGRELGRRSDGAARGRGGGPAAGSGRRRRGEGDWDGGQFGAQEEGHSG